MLSVEPTLAPLNVSGVGTLALTEGVAFSGAVATFTDPNVAGLFPGYMATIEWGDGQRGIDTSPGAIAGSAATRLFTITGSHTYADESATPETLLVRVHLISSVLPDSGDPLSYRTATDSVTVADAPLTGKKIAVTYSNGVSTGSITAAASTTEVTMKFTDANPGAKVGDFTAKIDWGDGVTASGIVSTAPGGFQVVGSHVYANLLHPTVQTETNGNTITVTVDDNGGSSLTMTTSDTASPSEQHLGGLFKGLLGRDPDPAAEQYWTQKLDGGATVDGVAKAIAQSNEFYAKEIIQPVYLQVQGRTATATEVDAIFNQYQKHLPGRRDLEAITLARLAPTVGSDTAFDDWIQTVFKAELGRQAGSSGETYWLAQLQAGKTPLQVAELIADGNEGTTRLIQSEFSQFIQRSPSAQELKYWLSQANTQGLTQELAAKTTVEDMGEKEIYL
ncbi:MAG TPA: DUF4214 domain-containing protein, partial [Pirellulales bacterium]|nr:DUF4214 domain-containing protein [Pirellulales bacterium]